MFVIVVDDRVEQRVARFALEEHVLAERAFVDDSKLGCQVLTRNVLVVGLPLNAAQVQVTKRMPQQEP